MPSKVILHEVSQSLMAVSVQNISFNSLPKGSTSHQMMFCTSTGVRQIEEEKWQYLIIFKSGTIWMSCCDFSSTPQPSLHLFNCALNSCCEVTFMDLKTLTMHKSAWKGVCNVNFCYVKIDKLTWMRITY